jgi:outer membrane protein OmpA-like peptidoglycan-associated protein
MSSLLHCLNEQISPDLIRELASKLGEAGDSVQEALLESGTAMLATLANKAHDSGFLTQIMNLISNFRAGSAMGAVAGGGSSTVTSASQDGTSFLKMLFGNNLPIIQNKVAEFSGIRVESAGSMLTSAAPLVLGTLASKVNSQGLTATGLGNLLSSELPSLRSYLPSSFSIPEVLGTTRAPQMAEEARTLSAPKWLWPALLAVLLIGALLWFTHRNHPTVKDAVNLAAEKASNAASQTSTAPSNAASPLGALVNAPVPGGVVINIPEYGMENKLLAFLRDPNAQPSRETWFEFDRLSFDPDGDHLQLSSQEQLENVAKILRAYPTVRALIGAYTDPQGDPAANLEFSQDRAIVVMAQLVALGVDSSRLDAKGYGSEHPVGDNSTLDGRAANRRIALRVTQK